MTRIAIPREVILILVLAWLYMSSLALALVYDITQPGIGLHVLKDVGAYGWLIAVVMGMAISRLTLDVLQVLFPLAVVLGYAFVTSDSSIFGKLASIRQITALFLLILVGIVFSGGGSYRLWLMRRAVALLLVVALFGFIERLSHFWESGVLVDYFMSKGVTIFYSGYPFIFVEPVFLWEGYGDIPGTIRMVSSFLDPINLGHTMVLLIVLGLNGKDYIVNWRARWLIVFVGGLALLLTISKGAMLQLALFLTVLNPRIPLAIRFTALTIIGVLMVMVGEHHQGLMVHALGFYSSLSSATMMGHGLGMVGNYAIMFGNSLDLGIGDSFVAAVLGQIGVIGLLAWLLPIVYISRILGWNHVLIRLLWAQILVSILSENAFNLLSIATIGILLGVELHYHWVRHCEQVGAQPKAIASQA